MRRNLMVLALAVGWFNASLAAVAAAGVPVKPAPVVALKSPAGPTAPATTKADQPLDAAKLMQALSLIESGDRDHAVGKAGEVSRYQIMPFVWREYKGGNPRNPTDARRVAILILTDRMQEFQAKHRRVPTLVETYALWRSPARAMDLRLSASVKECGRRFASLASDSVAG